MLSQKRKRLPSTSTGSRAPAADMRIQLPPSEFGMAQKPTDVQAPKPPQALFGAEVAEIFAALKSASLRAAELVRYQADGKKLGRPDDKNILPPKSLVASFSHDVDRLDQVCDVIEARILHSIALLMAEAKERRAKAAEEQAARDEALRQQQLQDIILNASIVPPTGTEVDNAIHTAENNPSVEAVAEESQEGTAPKIGSADAADVRRPSSTAPTVVSLSVAAGVMDVTDSASATSSNAKPRLERKFPLKLDLSGTALRAGFGNDIEAVSSKGPSSPVTLAPKTAKPRADDPVSAINFIGPPGFDAAMSAAAFSTHPNSVFSTTVPMPGLNNAMDTTNQMGGAGQLFPDILSTLTAPMAPNSFPILSTPPPQPEVIDLTQATPSFDSRLNLPGRANMETIDLTLDSPTHSTLGQFAKQPGVNDGAGLDSQVVPGVMAGLDLGVDMGGDTTKGAEPGQVEPADALDGLLSSLEDAPSGSVGTAAASLQQSADQSLPEGSNLPNDATSMLARLTATGDQTNSSAASNPFGDLGLGLPGESFPDVGGFADGLGLPGAADGNDVLQGMDLSDMSMYFNPTFGESSAAAAGDGASGMFGDDLQALMGEGGTAADLDFGSFLSGMDSNVADGS